MTFLRFSIRLRTPLGTPITSGGLWGHLAWAIRYLEGETSLRNWLEEQKHTPWLFSSAMPAGFLPRLLLPPVCTRDCDAGIETLDRYKRLRKLAWIPRQVFLARRQALSEENLVDALSAYRDGDLNPSMPKSWTIAHNTINRITARVRDPGGLFFHQDRFPTPERDCLDVYAKVPESEVSRLKRLLAWVGEQGFGRDASTGQGCFSVRCEEETELFDAPGNHLMSLSHGVVDARMGDCRYRLHTHFGKVGGHYVNELGNPFKYPLLLSRPGLTFKPDGEGPFGALLGGRECPVHPTVDEIYHHAWHLTVPYREVVQ